MLEHENDKQELDEEEVESRPGRDLYEWMQALVCSVLVVVLLFTFVVRLIGVDGHSMVPTLQDGTGCWCSTLFCMTITSMGILWCCARRASWPSPLSSG